MLASRSGVAARVLSLTAVLLASVGGSAHGQDTRVAPVTDAVLQNPPADDWLMWRRTLDGRGYSPLDQFDRGNVGDLRMAWRSSSTRC